MIEVRSAVWEDRHDFSDLWQLCFGDSDDFCQWFFHHRFAPSLSVCLKADDVFAACMQAFPYTIGIRGKAVKGVMLCGVCTHPDHRKKGYMGRIFPYDMQLLQKKGYGVAVHTPAVLPSYFSFGHYPVADACYLTAEKIPQMPSVEGVSILQPEEYRRAYSCYQAFAKQYSGIVWRTEADFLRKCADYNADGGKCMAYGKDAVEAYVFYYQTETELVCVEAVGKEGALEKVLTGIFAESAGLSLSVKLPPESDISFDFASKEVKQKGVMGLTDIQVLLSSLGLDAEAAFAVEDHVVPENNGCFLLNGERTEKAPAFSIPAGRLLQVLVGYTTLESQQPYLHIYDESGFLEIHNKLPKCNCYIIDEY